MLTLNRFGLSNFRVFKEYTEFEFAPITVLTGTNNSGKSSLLKALLLIQDNAKRNGLKELEFDGGEHNLGSWEFTKNKFSDSEVMEFGIGFKNVESDYFFAEYVNEFRYRFPFKDENKNNHLPYTFSTQIRNKEISNNSADFAKSLLTLFAKESKENSRYYSKNYGVEHFDWDNSEKEIFALNRIKLCRNGLPNIVCDEKFKRFFEPEEYTMANEFVEEVLNPAIWGYLASHSPTSILKNGEEFQYYDYTYFSDITIQDLISGKYDEEKYKPILVEKINRLPYAYLNTNPSQRELILNFRTGYYDSPIVEDFLIWQAKSILQFFNDLKEHFFYTDFYTRNKPIKQNSFKILDYLNFEYLSVTRGKQERAYQHSQKDTALESLLVQFLKANYAKDSKAQVFINKWLKAFDLAEEVVFQPIMKDVYTSIVFYKNGLELNISDLGFGITQLLPLLMKIVMCEGKMLLLEEPETNLHPLLQSRLADLFIDAYKTFDIQFVIETHSEYFVRRLQVMTAKYEQAKRNQADTSAFISPDESVIYYFHNPENVPEGKKQVEKIKIMIDGRLDNGFGEGFLDEATRQQFELVMLTTQINENQATYKTQITK